MGSRFYTSVAKLKHEIYERYIEDGVRKERRVPFSPFLFVQSNDDSTPYRSLTHLPIQKTVFDSIYAMDDYIKEFKGTRGYKIFGSDNPVIQYISERYPEANIPFDINLIHGCYLDIEVESGFRNEQGNIESNEFPSPAEAKYPITAITVYASHLHTSVTFGLETFRGEKLGTFDVNKIPDHLKTSLEDVKIDYRGYDDEADLLRAFVGFFKNESFDFITGWNSETFDIPYTCTRIDSVLGRKWTEQLSPVGIVRKKSFMSAYGEEVTFKITGVPSLDLKDIIDKHGFIELDNKKLNTAAKHFLGEEKLDYTQHKNLTEFLYNDYQNYIAYNIHDVNLVRRIDFKTKFIQLSYILSFLYHCNVEDTIATVQPWQHLTYTYAARMNQFTELKNRVLDKPEYIGAFVKVPTPGRYGWAISVDANALYPHMTQQFNMGVETILPNELAERVLDQMVKELGAIENRTTIQEQLMQKLSRREYIHEIYFEEPYEFQTLKTLGLCMAPNLAFFKTAQPSLLRQIFKYLYDTRKVIKKSMLSNEQIYENRKASESVDDLEELRDLITYEDKNQHGHKIAANAGYGAIAHEHFVDHFDIRIAEAITTAGQVSTRYIMRRLNEWINNEYGLTGEHVFYGDTDSIYCEFEKVVVHLGLKNKPQEEIVDFLDNLFKNTLEPLFITWAEELAKAYNCPINALFFKREAIASVAIFPAKKRYAMLVLDNEGVRYAKPKLKIVGLESRKSNYPALTREWMKTAYQLALEDDKDGLHDFVKACELDFMERDYSDYGAAQTVNNIEDFMDGNGGYIKGAPAHVKGAINHNNLVINMGLKDISLLKSGNKYFILPLRKGAPGRMETIAYDEDLPKEFNLDKFIDKEAAFEKTFISPLKNFLGAIKWEPTRPTTNSLDDLFS